MSNWLKHAYSWVEHLFARINPEELIGPTLGHLGWIAISFLLAFLVLHRAKRKFEAGDSEDVTGQANLLIPVPDAEGYFVLAIRNVVQATNVDKLFDNPAARKLVRKLIKRSTLASPILQTVGTGGFELLNTVLNYITGALAISPFPREDWLLVLTCEDRKFVRKHCARTFLIRPEDLEKFADWQWCTTHLRVERPYHYFRIVALHQIALTWLAQRGAPIPESATVTPVLDEKAGHNRIIPISVGVNTTECTVGKPEIPDWITLIPPLQNGGLDVALPLPPADLATTAA